MSTTYKTTTEPTVEPITLDELKTRLRVTSCDFDNELSDMLKAARKQVEYDTYRRLITQTVKLYLDDFPGSYGEIEIRLAPIQSITSIEYYDRDDSLQTYSSSNYYTSLNETPPEICLKQSQQWPNISLYQPLPVIITMQAGYGDAATNVPQAAKLAIVEYCRAMWSGCEGSTETYKRLVSTLKWTAYHEV